VAIRLADYELTPQGLSVLLDMEKPEYPIEWSFTNGQRAFLDMYYDAKYLGRDLTIEDWKNMFSNPEDVPPQAFYHVINALRNKGLVKRSKRGSF